MMKSLNLNLFLIYIFVITLLAIVLDWLWAIVIIVTIILLDFNSKTETEYCNNKKLEDLYLENLKYSDLQSKSSVSCIPSELHIKMTSHTHLIKRDKLVDGSEKASLSSLIHRGTTRKMGTQRNINQPLLSVLKNNTYLRNSYHQSPLKSPLYQSMSPAKLNCIYNSPLTPKNSFTSPLVTNQFTSPSVQMHYSDNFSNSRSSENVNNGLEIHGAYFLNKSLLHAESAENMYSLVNKNFSSPSLKRSMGNELYQTLCNEEKQEPYIFNESKNADKTCTESVISVLKASSKRKKETEKYVSPTTDQPSRSKRKKFDNSELDSTLNELFPPMLSSGSPLRKRISNIRSSANRLVSTASQYENLQEFKESAPVKTLNKAVVSRSRLGLTEEQTNELMDCSAQISPVKIENNYTNGEARNANNKLDKYTHTEKKVKFNDASTEFNDSHTKLNETSPKDFNKSNMLEKSKSSSLEKIKSSALKELKSPYRKIFSSLSSQTSFGSTEKLRDHPVYFTTHIDIDEIQNSREEFGSRGVSVSAFRNNQEHAAKLANDLLDDSDNYSKQKTLVAASLKEPIATSVEKKTYIAFTSSLPVSATTLFVGSSEKPNEKASAKLSPTFIKSDSLKSANQPITFGVHATSLAKVSTSENSFKLPESTFNFVSPSSEILPMSNSVASAVTSVQVVSGISNGSQSSVSFSSINPSSLNLSSLPLVSSSSSQIGFSFATAGFSFPTKISSELNTSVVTSSLTSGNSFAVTTSVSTSTPSISFSLSTLAKPTSNFSLNQFTNSTATSLAEYNSGLQTNVLSSNSFLNKNIVATSENFSLSTSFTSSSFPSSSAVSTSITTPFNNNLFGAFGEKSTGTFMFGNSAVCTSISASTQSSIFVSNTASSTTANTGVSQSLPQSLSNTFDKTNTFNFVASSVPPSVFNFNGASSQTSQMSNLFGTAPSSTLFASTTSMFASTTTNSFNKVGSVFGSTLVPVLSTASSSNQNIFGSTLPATSLLAAPTSQSTLPATVLFGAPAAQSTSLFGIQATKSTSSVFNPPAYSNFFGSATTVSSVPALFNQPAQVSSSVFNFGSSSSLPVTTSGFSFAPVVSSGFGTNNIFGNNTTVSASIFGAPPISSSGLFGASIPNSGSNIFAQTVPQSSIPNVFGSSTQQFSTSNLFGQSSQPSFNFGVSSAQPTNVFGVQSAPAKPAFNFSSQPATPSFNFSANDAQTPSFATLGAFGSTGQTGINFNSPIAGGGFSIGAGTPSSGRQTSKARRRLKK